MARRRRRRNPHHRTLGAPPPDHLWAARMTPEQTLPIELPWRQDDRSPVLARFLALAQEHTPA
jgi:hypothetical protein